LVSRLHARVGCPACSGIRHNMLKFIDLDQARSKVGAGEAERPLSDLRLRDSSVDRATICWRGEIGWNAACASYPAPSRLLQKSARAVRRRGSGVGIPSVSANPRCSPSIQRFTSSPCRLATTVAVNDWDLIVAFVAPDRNGGPRTQPAVRYSLRSRWRCGSVR
jgi:hypothetical protein